MKIDVSKLLRKSGNKREYRETWSPEQIDLENSLYSIKSPLEVYLFLFNAEGTIEVDGSYRGTLEYYCNRCLTEITDQLNGSVSARFYPPEREITGDLEEKVDDNLYLGNYTEDEAIEVLSLIREDIVLDRPMQVLCSSDCQGLCPECGQNLNEQDCGHDREKVDPRLSKLQEMDISEEE